MEKFSEKLGNDKICNCTGIPCSLLTGYHLVPKYSKSIARLAVPSQFGGHQKKFVPPNSAPSFRHCCQFCQITVEPMLMLTVYTRVYHFTR